MFALIAMTFDRAVGGGGEEWGDKKSDMLLDMDGVETNLFDGEEDEMDQGLDSMHSSRIQYLSVLNCAPQAAEEAGSAFKEGYEPCEKVLIEGLRKNEERKNDTGQKVRTRSLELYLFTSNVRMRMYSIIPIQNVFHNGGARAMTL